MTDGPAQPRPVGLRLIITYKFVKGPISLGIAAALTFASARSMHFLAWVIHQISDLGPFMAHIGHWLHAHLSSGITGKAAILAWLDGSSTVIEGILLATGKGWAEWVVVAVLGMLIPFEGYGFVRHPTKTRAMVMIVNALVVAYLAWRRIEAERAILHEHAVLKRAAQLQKQHEREATTEAPGAPAEPREPTDHPA